MNISSSQVEFRLVYLINRLNLVIRFAILMKFKAKCIIHFLFLSLSLSLITFQIIVSILCLMSIFI